MGRVFVQIDCYLSHSRKYMCTYTWLPERKDLLEEANKDANISRRSYVYSAPQCAASGVRLNRGPRELPYLNKPQGWTF